MKWRSVLFLIFSLLAVAKCLGQTNFVPRVEADGQSYTNVHIMRTTAQYAVVEFDGGAAQIALSNFPPAIQQQYGYDPEKARQEAIAEAARREQAQALEAEQNAALLKLQNWRGNPMAATVLNLAGTVSVWTKCQIQVSNKTETVLLSGLPIAVQQFFINKNSQSNQMATLSASIEQQAQQLNELKARLPAHPRANSPASRELRQINSEEKLLAQKRAELQKMQAENRKLLAQEKQATRVSVRQTAQTYASLPVWECVK